MVVCMSERRLDREAPPPASPPRFDPNALRAKYREERDKRLRADGNDQYIEIAGRFAHYADDPYAGVPIAREPRRDDVDVALIGGGFGGLLAGAHLRELGVRDLRLIEKGGDVGGTWYFNRYPGIACDVESYVYMPLLEEIGALPSEKYARGTEIFEHCRAIARKYDLYRDACLQTEVREIRWDPGAARWIIQTNRGDAMRARFVCLANGYLQKPKLPGIPGIERFRGPSFHTSRWDYSVTGGDASGNLAKLCDKRVGIIGTGASAVQCIPHLGASAKQLFVFQRTPSSVDVRANRPTDPAWAASLRPGWQRERIDNFQILTTGGFAEQDLVADGWTDIVRKLLSRRLAAPDPASAPEELARTLDLADFEKMEEIRARVAKVVRDPATAEALKPWYGQFCKRPCFHDEYLETFNRPNVTLVDTQGRGVERITEKGVVAGGREVELDVLIYATGFEVATDYSRRAGFRIIGRDGVTLSDAWKNGIRTLHGIHIHGFPNCFMLSIAQSGFTVNFPYLLDVQARHIAYIAERALASGVSSLEVSAAAEAAWVDEIIRIAERSGAMSDNCTPGYYNEEGRRGPASRQNSFYFGGPTEYAELLARWRADGSLAGLVRC
jgi:cation diffusion facilitator CzcD-associated flavoprotein CzcO